jgi:hypothetical protein
MYISPALPLSYSSFQSFHSKGIIFLSFLQCTNSVKPTQYTPSTLNSRSGLLSSRLSIHLGEGLFLLDSANKTSRRLDQDTVLGSSRVACCAAIEFIKSLRFDSIGYSGSDRDKRYSPHSLYSMSFQSRGMIQDSLQCPKDWLESRRHSATMTGRAYVYCSPASARQIVLDQWIISFSSALSLRVA